MEEDWGDSKFTPAPLDMINWLQTNSGLQKAKTQKTASHRHSPAPRLQLARAMSLSAGAQGNEFALCLTDTCVHTSTVQLSTGSSNFVLFVFQFFRKKTRRNRCDLFSYFSVSFTKAIEKKGDGGGDQLCATLTRLDRSLI
jgi:hypothetical protein